MNDYIRCKMQELFNSETEEEDRLIIEQIIKDTKESVKISLLKDWEKHPYSMSDRKAVETIDNTEVKSHEKGR